MESREKSIQNYLVERSQSNDRKAQNELYLLYADAMFNICRRLLGDDDDAMDALQESFISAFTKIKSLRDPGMFTAWLKRIVINHCMNVLKKRKEYMEEWNDNHDIAEEDNRSHVDYQQYESQRIMQAIDLLPGGARTVLNLYLFEGYDHKEISSILDITVSASKAQYSKARKRVREILSSH